MSSGPGAQGVRSDEKTPSAGSPYSIQTLMQLGHHSSFPSKDHGPKTTGLQCLRPFSPWCLYYKIMPMAAQATPSKRRQYSKTPLKRRQHFSGPRFRVLEVGAGGGMGGMRAVPERGNPHGLIGTRSWRSESLWRPLETEPLVS